MNKVEQGICRIREKLPNNQGFVTLGVGCVVKNEELAASLGWKCPNLIVTSAAVLSPEHLALDRIFLAEFLVFEKKGFEVFDLKLASEFCKTVSSRAMSDEEVRQLPNDRVTVISVEPLDKRSFLKRMVKRSTLQTTRPIDCFNFQDLQNELSVGIFCNVIREFGSLAQEFETRTYKFKHNPEKQQYFLEDFGDQSLELEQQSFPDDQQLIGGVIFSKFGAYVGCLGYGTSQIVPCFVPSSQYQVAENQEKNQEQEEKSNADLLVEGAGSLDNENKQNELPVDENKNEDNDVRLSVKKDEDLHGEDSKDKTAPEDNAVDSEEETGESNEEKEPSDKLSEEEQESGKSCQNIDNEKGVPIEEVSQENLEKSNVLEEETSVKERNDEMEVSENVEDSIDLNKDEESFDHLVSVQSSENENQEDVNVIVSGYFGKQDEIGDVVSSKLEHHDVEGSRDSVLQDGEAGSVDNKENEKELVDVEEQTLLQETDSQPSASNDNEDVCEVGDVAMESCQHSKESPGEESAKLEDGLEPSMSLHTETDVKNSDDEIVRPMSDSDEMMEMEVKGASDSLDIGTESSTTDQDTHVVTDQVKSDDQMLEADKEKVNECKPVMEKDNNVLINEDKTEYDPHGVTSEENAVPTLEEQLDMQLYEKTRESKAEETQGQVKKEEEDAGDPIEDKEATTDTDVLIPLERSEENDSSLVEMSSGMSIKMEETLQTDGPVMKEEVHHLEPPQSPREAQDDLGESLEPDALLSSTITNNHKVLDDLAILLDTEYQQGGIASWHDMALLLDIPKEAFDHCLSYSKSSPTESLLMFLSNTKPQFTIRDLKDALRSICRIDVVHALDRYIARSIVSDESVIVGVVERDDTDLLGELALKLDRGILQNWKSLAIQLEVPRRIFKQFGSQQRQNPAILMLKYLPIFDPDLTVESLKEACKAISKFDVVKFLDGAGVPGDDAIMDILDDTDIIDEVTDMLNDDEVGPNWKDLAKELNIPAEKFSIFESSANKSPTKLLLQSVEQCEPDLTVEELILALVAMKRHDVIDMLYKHFKRSDIRSILEGNNCLPPEPEVHKKDDMDNDAESSA